MSMFTKYPKQPQTEQERIRQLSYKLDMLLSGISYDVEEREREEIFSYSDYLKEIKSKIDIALNAGVDINSLGRVSCLNSLLEGCRNLPEIYKGLTADLVNFLIKRGADVVSSGCFYEDVTPLALAQKLGYDEKVVNLIETAIEQVSNKATSKEL